VIGVLQDDQVRTAGFGFTNLDHPLKVTDGTLFQIGSITKTYVGTLTMKLVEAGELDLDTTVRTYLPDFKVADAEASEKATLRHLMTHTSGWVGDLFIDTGSGDDAPAKYMAEMAGLEQLAPLGQFFSYNNAGFSLLGVVIEKVTGKSFPAALQELLLEPLGLESTFFDPADVITHRFASGHVEGRVARPWALPRAIYPAGGITCSVHDLLAYAQFHMGDGRLEGGDRLLKQDSLVQMQTPVVTVWKEEKWGLTTA
jgi:CubicO group peptidase (beta-lactamase class C family)